MPGKVVIVVTILAILPPFAIARERVTLSNGFEISCDHHVQHDGIVRLYFSADEDNYVDRAPQDIAKIEHVDDPPPPPPEPADPAPKVPASPTSPAADA